MINECENEAVEIEEETMTNLQFFQSLNYEDGIEVAVKTFERFPLQYGTTLGLNGSPQIRPLEFKFEQDGVLYFDTVTYYTSYKEMLAYPYLQMCVCDQETMTYVRVTGTVNFTEDEDIINRCFENSEVLTSQFGNNRSVVIAYYLTDFTIEFTSFSSELQNYFYHFDSYQEVFA